MSQTHSLTTSPFALSTISQLFVDRFGPFLRFCHQEFDKEVILMVSGVKMAGIGGGYLNFKLIGVHLHTF